jgi:hypothetical protein
MNLGAYHDSFDQLDPRYWGKWGGHDEDITVTGGAVSIIARAGVGSVYNGIQTPLAPAAGSPLLHDFRAGGVVSGEYELGDMGPFVNYTMAMRGDVAVGTNALLIGTDGTSIGTTVRTLGVSDSVWVPYDPVAHRWWRIREAAGTTLFEFSPDGLDWTEVRSIATPSWANRVSVDISSGYWNGNAVDAEMVLTNFNWPPITGSGPATGTELKAAMRAIQAELPLLVQSPGVPTTYVRALIENLVARARLSVISVVEPQHGNHEGRRMVGDVVVSARALWRDLIHAESVGTYASLELQPGWTSFLDDDHTT